MGSSSSFFRQVPLSSSPPIVESEPKEKCLICLSIPGSKCNSCGRGIVNEVLEEPVLPGREYAWSRLAQPSDIGSIFNNLNQRWNSQW